MSVAHLPDAVKVAVGIRRTIVVDYDINTFHIDSTTKDISRNKYTFLKCFESGITINSTKYRRLSMAHREKVVDLPLFLR